MKDEGFGKPFIAVCSSHVEIFPGHVHLDEVAEVVSAEIRAAGLVARRCQPYDAARRRVLGHCGQR